MEFLGGIIFTLFLGFIYYKFDQAKKRKAARAAYVPRAGAGQGRPVKDYPKENLD